MRKDEEQLCMEQRHMSFGAGDSFNVNITEELSKKPDKNDHEDNPMSYAERRISQIR